MDRAADREVNGPITSGIDVSLLNGANLFWLPDPRVRGAGARVNVTSTQPVSCAGTDLLTFPSVTSAGTPALAAYNGDLYVSWSGSTSAIEYASFNGTSWTSPATLVSNNYGYPPSLAVVGRTLYDAWIDGTNGYGDVTYAAFNGASWSADAAIPLSLTCNGMAIAGYGGALYAAWQSAD